MEEEALTYDALRRVERQENTSPRLTKLEPGFWERLGEHLNTLREAFQEQQEEDPTARRTVVLADELRNTQRLAEGIWASREKKVVQAAMGAVRRREGEASVPGNATKEERDLFVAAMKVMLAARDEAAITDPFAKRRRDRLQQAAGESAGSKTGQADGGSTDVKTGAADKRAPGRPMEPPAERAQVAKAPAGVAGEGSGQATSGGLGGPGEGAGEGDGEGAGEATGGPREPRPGRQEGVGEGGGSVGGGAGAGIEAAGEKAREEAPDDERGAGVGGTGEQEVELRVVQAMKAVPLFAGPDLVTYELAEGEVGSLPVKAAEILEQRGLVRILEAE